MFKINFLECQHIFKSRVSVYIIIIVNIKTLMLQNSQFYLFTSINKVLALFHLSMITAISSTDIHPSYHHLMSRVYLDSFTGMTIHRFRPNLPYTSLENPRSTSTQPVLITYIVLCLVCEVTADKYCIVVSWIQ